MKTWIIYTLAHPTNLNEIRYVGATSLSIEERKKSHLRAARSLKKNFKNVAWIRSLTKEGIEPHIEIIDLCDCNNWQATEQYWIEQFKVWGFKLNNMVAGGLGAKSPSLEVREKIRIANTGKSAWNKGLTFSEESRKLMSESHKGQIPWNKGVPGLKGEDNPSFGKKRSNEQIANMSKTTLNLSQDKKNNIIEAVKKANSKAIIQCATNGDELKRWTNGSIASSELSIHHGHISDCCSGKRKTAGGYVWKYQTIY